jgi:hypothetical protein
LQDPESAKQASQGTQKAGEVMSLSSRLAALESRRLGSLHTLLGAGPIALVDANGVSVVHWCFDHEQPRLAGLPDLRSKARWRDRQTCPDVGICPNAGDCLAGGTGPSSLPKKTPGELFAPVSLPNG